MKDDSSHTGENRFLTGYEPDDCLTNNKNQEVSLTSDIFNLDDASNEDFISVFNLEIAEATADNLTRSYTEINQNFLSDEKSVDIATNKELGGSYTDTVGVSSVNNNLAAGYDNQVILTTSLPKSETTNVWGTPVADSNYWRLQNGSTTCALIAEISIYESITGKYISESTIATYAEAQGWFDPLTGTSLNYVGSVLNAYGIETNQYSDNNYDGDDYDVNLDNIVAALNNGDKVIAALDGNEIWKPSYNTLTGRPYEQTDPGEVAHQDYNHAVWVTGIEQYSDNTWNIILNDSGTDFGQAEAVNYWDFMNAWDDSDNFLTIVDAG
ncbi:MAG TPA: hypothetical protein V6C71_10775 [Coleofasciculaceae cyanobacterium]|jgi:hypothetical protein